MNFVAPDVTGATIGLHEDAPCGGNVNFKRLPTVALNVAGGCLALAGAQTHRHDTTAPASPGDFVRQLVRSPEPMRLHTIASMRDHLLALHEIAWRGLATKCMAISAATRRERASCSATLLAFLAATRP